MEPKLSNISTMICIRVPLWSSASMLDHRSLPPEFESWHGHIWRLFYLWLCSITFGGCSAHLAYHVFKSGCKTPIIIIIIIITMIYNLPHGPRLHHLPISHRQGLHFLQGRYYTKHLSCVHHHYLNIKKIKKKTMNDRVFFDVLREVTLTFKCMTQRPYSLYTSKLQTVNFMRYVFIQQHTRQLLFPYYISLLLYR